MAGEYTLTVTDANGCTDTAKTTVTVLIGGKAVFTREIYVAGNDFTRAVSNRLNTSQEEAETMKVSADEKSTDIIEATAPLVDDLSREVALCFDYCENQYECSIGEVLLSGGGSLLWGLQPALESSLGRSITLWDPTAAIPVGDELPDPEGFKQQAPHLGIAFGLAARV